MARHPFSRRARRRMRTSRSVCPCALTDRVKRCSHGCRAIWRERRREPDYLKFEINDPD